MYIVSKRGERERGTGVDGNRARGLVECRVARCRSARWLYVRFNKERRALPFLLVGAVCAFQLAEVNCRGR